MRILDGAFLDALETLDINVQQMKSGHYSGARRSRAYGSSPEFADYREYVPATTCGGSIGTRPRGLTNT